MRLSVLVIAFGKDIEQTLVFSRVLAFVKFLSVLWRTLIF